MRFEAAIDTGPQVPPAASIRLLILVHDRTTPCPTIDLHRCPDRQSYSIVSEERGLSPRVRAQIEVDIRTILVRPRESRLRAQWVSLRWAQIVNHDDDRCACIGERVAGGVGLTSESPAGAAGGTCASTGANAVNVLAHGCAKARVGVEAACGGVGVTVGGAESIACTVVGEGGFESWTAG